MGNSSSIVQEEVYDIVCDVCETTCEVITENDFETPSYCPFCGSVVGELDV